MDASVFKLLRRLAEQSQEQVAAVAGVSQSTYSRIERGVRAPSSAEIAAIEAALAPARQLLSSLAAGDATCRPR